MQVAELPTAEQLVRTATEAAARFRGVRPQLDDTTVLALLRRGPVT